MLAGLRLRTRFFGTFGPECDDSTVDGPVHGNRLRAGPQDRRLVAAEAISLILEDRREDGLRGLPPDTVRETVRIK